MSQLLSRTIDVAQHDDVYEFMFDQGITDGLPLVPPTPRRVERMLAGTARSPSELIGKIPPNYAPATVEKIAINAVAAGARPDYLPVIIAAVEAAAGGRLPLHGTIASTDGISPMMIVNGPIRERIGMNWGLNALGQGNRANMTIGRALRLVLRNVGGAREGEIDQTVQGGAHKFTLTFAEHEDATPWPPLHVEHGYDRADSVVTLLPVIGGPRLCIDEYSRTARALVGSLAMGFQRISSPNGQIGPSMLVVSPEHADVFRRDGWSKGDVREAIMKLTALPIRDRLATDRIGGGLSETALRREGVGPQDLDRPMSKVSYPSHILITVAGATAGKRTGIYPGIVRRMDPEHMADFTPVSARIDAP
ncbi:MAG: hypothetical protein OXI41_00015 [Chloroflexota bacterium]|nr:hypothetical protein [Chloroflexota bacterium]MDE2896156.1 hypothetical protein [Chloroflexota bacterium]